MIHCSRREWLRTAGAFSAAALLGEAQVSSNTPATKLSMPGLYPGRVVSVFGKDSVIDGNYQAAPIAAMIRRGMAELTGTDGGPDAWKQFVQPGEVVGIKVNPNSPFAMSSPEALGAIIAGLNSAGVKNSDIVVFERYRGPLYDGGIPGWLPQGVRAAFATAGGYTDDQTDITGYDPDHYLELPLTIPVEWVAGPEAERARRLQDVKYRRSYAALFITREVNKLINLPILKHHQSAGVTLALKNLSHGLTNNVNRSHITPTANACGAYIPSAVSIPAIRNKTVLNILDGAKGVFHGGPRGRQQFVWEPRTIYFATDPVAIDAVGLEAIDDKRVAAGLKKVSEAQPDSVSTFLHPQPEHIEFAGAIGLGVADRKKIDLRRVTV
jgi:uncharacterized protein (DUF362 family)